MLFNSYIFVLFFLPLSVLVYFILNRYKAYGVAELFLLFMSLWFYAYFNIIYLPIILVSILFNYGIYLGLTKIENQTWRKLLLWGGGGLNVGILFYFKYYDFFISNLNVVFKTDYTLRNLVLPLGISFFTFQQLSFVIDSYRKETPPYNLRTYALFVVFFPQLIAGPIVTHTEIIPQFMDVAKRKLCWRNLSCGIYVFALGLIKKVIMADTFGNVVNWGFSHYEKLNATNAFLTMLCYTIQIYFDFSGYCDMALGIGKMFNIDLPLNFNSPYKALTITEFWERWHMTLTRFFTKYVYIPLGGNRKGALRMYINTMVVFLASGVWHGANWTFILWGLIHGIFIVITKKWNAFFQKLHPALNWIITFSFVNVTLVLFRADSISQAVNIVKPMLKLDLGPIDPSIMNNFQLEEIVLSIKLILGKSAAQQYPFIYMVFFLLVSLIIILGKNNSYEHMLTFKPNIINGAITVIFLIWSILSFSGVSTFLYFNF